MLPNDQKKHLILLKYAIKILAIRSIFAFHAKGAQGRKSAQSRRDLRKKGWNQLGSKRPWIFAGDRGGARAGKPRWFRILVIAVLSRMAAMIFIFPPQCGQRSMSISNTRLSKHAQLMRTEAGEGGTSSFVSDALLLFFLLPGIISARSLAFGASTPWKRMRLSLGRGINAARRCMNSNGDMTICVVLSR